MCVRDQCVHTLITHTHTLLHTPRLRSSLLHARVCVRDQCVRSGGSETVGLQEGGAEVRVSVQHVEKGSVCIFLNHSLVASQPGLSLPPSLTLSPSPSLCVRACVCVCDHVALFVTPMC